MYSNHYGAASPQPTMSSNPFIEDPTTAHARFPDLNASHLQPGFPSNGYPNQPQQYQQYPAQSYGPYQQATSPQSQFASTSYTPQYPPQGQMGPQPTGIGIGAFQPSPSFAQQLPQQYPVPSYTYSGGYPPQTAAAAPSYISEFDPYAAQAQGQGQSQGQIQAQSTTSSTTTGPPGVSHPRDLIRTHKSGLEAWEAYSWKQLFNACDALKEAWGARKQQAQRIVQQYGGHADPGLFSPDPAFGYGSQLDGWKQVLKDANDHFDTVAASTFQLHEVFNSYRQSADAASKQRVRESCNAAVKGLPDWPGN